MRMQTIRVIAAVPTLTFYLGLVACSGETHADAAGGGESGQPREAAGERAMPEGGGEHSVSEGRGEHAEGGEGGEHEEGGEHGSEGEGEGEESGVYVGSGDTWDATPNGLRLVLSFDPAANAFIGSVENTTPVRLCAIRVEVHLSTGTELDPTERTDLDPGHTSQVRLPASGEVFEAWTAHPELSPCGGG